MQPHMPLLNLCKFDVNRLPLVNTEQYCIFWNVLLVLSKKNSSRKLSLKYGMVYTVHNIKFKVSSLLSIFKIFQFFYSFPRRYRAGNSLIHSFRSFRSHQMSNCEQFAQIAQDNWSNCSGRSYQKSDREQIAQVAHDK